ncbi:RcpC/CpaB family pilus assembly protein [Streptomyces sp. NPDC088766]|uniref:RcpC/CpaB family pilus assembly protein n=1 Tax=Streptomyces sp. NPDC088766 TaxID=3365893 RepID=UPI0038157129
MPPSPSLPVPPSCEVPPFAPVRVRGGLHRLRLLAGTRRRALAVGLAVTAAALVAAGPRDGDTARGHPGGGSHAGEGSHVRAQSSARAPSDGRRTAGRVRAPVRIADAATVRLLRPGDRVDVIAVDPAGRPAARDGEARVVARGALVTKVPDPSAGAGGGEDGADLGVEGSGDGGALVVLSVPRSTAARLAGAGATARLAVTLW